MSDQNSDIFKASLIQHDISGVRSVPKSDLHNHFVLGGNRKFIEQHTGYQILPMKGIAASMQAMDAWNTQYLGARFDNTEMRHLLIDATFYQAKTDGVTVLEIGEDVWGLGRYFHGDIDTLIEAFSAARKRIAPDIALRLQIGLSRHCPISYLERCLDPFWGRKEFYSIDLYGDELAQPIENFIPIYQKAKGHGLKLKAHIGEFGSADDVVGGVELLHLDEVQHGIAAAGSPKAMEYLLQNHIRLNVTPTSNIKLGRVADYANHPIRELFRYGIDVTINSDDVLIFDSDVSKEYMRLFQHGTLTADELDQIRISGLS